MQAMHCFFPGSFMSVKQWPRYLLTASFSSLLQPFFLAKLFWMVPGGEDGTD